MLRRRFALLAVTVCAGATFGFGVPSVTASDSPTPTTMPGTSVTDSTSLSNFLTDLQNDPSVCIGFNPPPNCGRKPTQAGDRGGALQYTVFAVMMAGLAVIGTVIVRKIIARDRMIAESLTDSD